MTTAGLVTNSMTRPAGGNKILRQMFDALHTSRRNEIPPVFVFTKAGQGRDVIFRGLAVPGASDLSQTEDLVAVWKTSDGSRFQNYRAVFTILDVPRVDRAWVNRLGGGENPTKCAPAPWALFRSKGIYTPLQAPKTAIVRSAEMQLPNGSRQEKLLSRLVSFYKNHPSREYAFEKCAAEILKLMDNNTATLDLTRPWRDGGRDAVGTYRIGPRESPILVEFALEAKCKGPVQDLAFARHRD